MYDFSIFSRKRHSPANLSNLQFDVLISAFNDSERVASVFTQVSAIEKYWLIHREYGYRDAELPRSSWWVPPDGLSEIDVWEEFFQAHPIDANSKVAIDITGMMRQHLMVLPLVLKRAGLTKATFLYSDPVSYKSGQATTFTKGPVERVGVVPGYAGTHRPAFNARDCLIIGAGYDIDLVKAAAEDKRNADHYLVVGMPGLQAHMYQESIYRVSQVKEAINDLRNRSLLFAPANNPFMTAQVISDHISSLKARGEAQNFYLCPVGPKTQVLGFAWYYLCEAIGTSTSIIFPYARRYSRETSSGLAAVHEFTLEFDALPDPLSR
ncbi:MULTISPECIES: hypothetical protein [unclassified Rathayibacter]|uniref:hypothetical protein n=1 Tax=unclassified Rathayibacter TaxID=2609250 RepID=UPI0011B031C0|nr:MULTISPECIES: hypothetical protein [unclassified Rathayibacter]